MIVLIPCKSLSAGKSRLEACLDAEAWAQGVALMTSDHAEGIASFKEKRTPRFQGR